MSIDTALSSFTRLALRSAIRDDDGIDQLHHFVTVSILVFFAAVTGVVEYAGEPINCWNYGAYLWKHFQDHVNSYCWTHSLYHYPDKTNRSVMPYGLNELGAAQDPTVHLGDEEVGQITFYRWVTIIFLLQAFCFKLPNLLWTEFNAYSGSNIVKMVEMLQSVLFTNDEEKQQKLRQVAFFLEQWLSIHRKHPFLKEHRTPKTNPEKHVSSTVKRTQSCSAEGTLNSKNQPTQSCCTLWIGNNIRNYLSSLYLVTKLVYLVNVILQFLVLSAFLQLNFWHFGPQTLHAYDNQKISKATTETFPIVALCHFQTYDINANTNHDGATGKWVQCILTINVFLEKLFLIEWFWLLLLLIMTCINFCVWCFKILQTRTALRFAERYMKLLGVYTAPLPVPKGCSVEQFVMEYLRNDGIFVLRILAVNTNEVVVAELVEECWKRYLEFEEHPHLAKGASMDMGEAETAFDTIPSNDDRPPDTNNT
ncbi:innexin unc-9-like isoform X2 [Littorina saxatilis]|uniref:innexin unc-9-like isoform X2 n=1 Tax=Littorina saxatilis TaxID=31220 RepID=UPI0038B4B35A